MLNVNNREVKKMEVKILLKKDFGKSISATGKGIKTFKRVTKVFTDTDDRINRQRIVSLEPSLFIAHNKLLEVFALKDIIYFKVEE